MKLQAIHNKVKTDQKDFMKKFQKHIRDIFEMLEQLIAKNDLYGFVTCLSNEIKNLCCRLGKTGAMDKKLERALK